MGHELTQNIYKTIQHYFASLLIAMLCILVLSHSSITTQSVDLSTYDKQLQEQQVKAAEFEKKLSDYSGNLEDLNSQATNLNTYIQQTQKEIQELDATITDLNGFQGSLEEQKKQTEKEKDDLQNQAKGLLQEIEKADNSRARELEAVIASNNIFEVITTLANLNSLGPKVTDLDQKLTDKEAVLQNNIQNVENNKKRLSAAKAISKSKQDGYSNNLNAVQGDQKKWEELIQGIKSARQQTLADVDRIAGERQIAFEKNAQEEAEKARKALEAEKQTKNTPNTKPATGPGQLGKCFFEDTANPGIPAGFFINPVGSGYQSQGFGVNSVSGNYCNHDGVDVASAWGSDLNATADGVIVYSGFQGGGFGYHVVLQVTLPNKRHIYALYAHMAAYSDYKVGAQVTQGQKIGVLGSTGSSTGPHLHFMLITDSYEASGVFACRYAGNLATYCYDPAKYIPGY